MVSYDRKISDKIYIEVINDLLEKWQRSEIEESKQKEVKMKMMEIVSFCAHMGYNKKMENEYIYQLISFVFLFSFWKSYKSLVISFWIVNLSFANEKLVKQ